MIITLADGTTLLENDTKNYLKKQGVEKEENALLNKYISLVDVFVDVKSYIFKEDTQTWETGIETFGPFFNKEDAFNTVAETCKLSTDVHDYDVTIGKDTSYLTYNIVNEGVTSQYRLYFYHVVKSYFSYH